MAKFSGWFAGALALVLIGACSAALQLYAALDRAHTQQLGADLEATAYQSQAGELKELARSPSRNTSVDRAMAAQRLPEYDLITPSR